MKKAMALILALVFTFCGAFALAEEIDLSGLTDDALLALRNRVQAEIVARHMAGTADLASGKYIAGEDIPVGSYIYTAKATGNDWASVTIYADHGDGDQLFWQIVDAPEEGEEQKSFFITLNEGDQLKSLIPFSLTIYSGVVFQ